MKKNCIYILSCLLWLFSLKIQAQIHFLPTDQIDSLMHKEARPIVAYIYADWCQYCGLMENTTLRHQPIIDVLAEKFYTVALNAEEKKDLFIFGRRFSFQPSGAGVGIHELAKELATDNGKISYPTMCIVNTKKEIVFRHTQFIGAVDLLEVLNKIEIE